MRRSKPERGFSLVELMVVVGVMGILAAVALVAYRKYIAQARRSEVFSMIASIKSSQEAYKAETSQYISTGSSEADYYPALIPASEPLLKKWDPSGDSKAAWSALGVSPPAKQLYCGYVTRAGNASQAPSEARGATLFQTNPIPGRPWYYIRAECDFDSDSSVNSIFETTFDSQIVFTDNEGR